MLIFLKTNGEVLKFSTNKEAGNYFKEQGRLSNSNINSFWEFISRLEPTETFFKSQADFLNKYKLTHSTFNVGCLHRLKAVYLFENQYLNLKNEGLI